MRLGQLGWCLLVAGTTACAPSPEPTLAAARRTSALVTAQPVAPETLAPSGRFVSASVEGDHFVVTLERTGSDAGAFHTIHVVEADGGGDLVGRPAGSSFSYGYFAVDGGALVAGFDPFSGVTFEHPDLSRDAHRPLADLSNHFINYGPAFGANDSVAVMAFDSYVGGAPTPYQLKAYPLTTRGIALVDAGITLGLGTGSVRVFDMASVVPVEDGFVVFEREIGALAAHHLDGTTWALTTSRWDGGTAMSISCGRSAGVILCATPGTAPDMTAVRYVDGGFVPGVITLMNSAAGDPVDVQGIDGGFDVTWLDTTGPRLMQHTISIAGAPVGVTRQVAIVAPEGLRSGHHLLSTARRSLLVYEQVFTTSFAQRTRGALVDWRTGTLVAAAMPIAKGHTFQTWPTVSPMGTGALVTFGEDRDNLEFTSLYARTVDDLGAPTGSLFPVYRVLPPLGLQVQASAACSAGDAGVLGLSSVTFPPELWFTRLTPSGAQAVAPLKVSTFDSYDRLRCATGPGQEVGFVGSGPSGVTKFYRGTMAALSAGTTLPLNAIEPNVTFDGSRYIVSALYIQPDGGLEAPRMTFIGVLDAGVLSGPVMRMLAAANGTVLFGRAVPFDGGGLLSWEVVGSDAGWAPGNEKSGAFASRPTALSATWDGTQGFAAISTDLSDGSSGVVPALLTASAVRWFSTPIPTSNRNIDSTVGRLADGGVVLVFADPLTSRLNVSRLFTLGPGAACGHDVECQSTWCTDGVCCDSACGGADTSDCQACSVATGAPTDGVCNVRAVSTVCRPAVNSCDVAERCDGTATSCPADDLASVDGGCTPTAGQSMQATATRAQCSTAARQTEATHRMAARRPTLVRRRPMVALRWTAASAPGTSRSAAAARAHHRRSSSSGPPRCCSSSAVVAALARAECAPARHESSSARILTAWLPLRFARDETHNLNARRPTGWLSRWRRSPRTHGRGHRPRGGTHSERDTPNGLRVSRWRGATRRAPAEVTARDASPDLRAERRAGRGSASRRARGG